MCVQYGGDSESYGRLISELCHDLKESIALVPSIIGDSSLLSGISDEISTRVLLHLRYCD